MSIEQDEIVEVGAADDIDSQHSIGSKNNDYYPNKEESKKKHMAQDSQTGTKRPKRPNSLLPIVTPEMEAEYEAEKRLRYSSSRTHEEPPQIFGIPYWLMMALFALFSAVTAGTVLAVLYYDGTPQTSAPTTAPSLAP